MDENKNPAWWTKENDIAWDRIKQALKEDFEQSKRPAARKFSTRRDRERSENQAAGVEAVPPPGQSSYEDLEDAYRFGHGARSKFGAEYPDWDEDLEQRLREDWRTMHPTRKQHWEQDRSAIRYGWNFKAKNPGN